MSDEAALDAGAVHEAAAALRGLVYRTPSIRCEALDELTGVELWIKAENLQRIGAFKARGALYAVGKLAQAERERGLITYSSGNHAQAVALAARHYKTTADIAMPVDAPAVKVEAVKRLGARITLAGRTSDERRQRALNIQARTGGALIEPFDHRDTIAGQGTAALELFEDVAHHTAGQTLDALVVPVGGGGLIAGACLAAEARPTQIYSVEPVGCDSMARSLAAGHIVAVEPGPTLADGLRPTRVGKLTFAIAARRVAGSFTVDDAQIGRAVVTLLLRARLLAEPSAAAALAVLLDRQLPGSPRRVGILLSGGNIAPDILADLLQKHIGSGDP